VTLRLADFIAFFSDCHGCDPFPWQERLCAQVMVLPTGTAVSAEDIARIGGVMRAALAAAPAVRERLRALRGEP